MKAAIDLLKMTLEDDQQWNRKGRISDLQNAISVLEAYPEAKTIIDEQDQEIKRLKATLHKLHQQGGMETLGIE